MVELLFPATGNTPVWSRRFIWIGAASGVIVAGLAFAGIAAAVDFVMGLWFLPGGIITTSARVLAPGILGVAVYPVCWYMFIVRRRDYSRAQTCWMILGTFALTLVAASAAILILYTYAALMSPDPLGPVVIPMILVITFAPITSAVFLLPFYVPIAGSLAFLHRTILLALFGEHVEG
jgi:hypothetical protein